jgi:hypothetical protein
METNLQRKREATSGAVDTGLDDARASHRISMMLAMRALVRNAERGRVLQIARRRGVTTQLAHGMRRWCAMQATVQQRNATLATARHARETTATRMRVHGVTNTSKRR